MMQGLLGMNMMAIYCNGHGNGHDYRHGYGYDHDYAYACDYHVVLVLVMITVLDITMLLSTPEMFLILATLMMIVTFLERLRL